MSSQLTDWDAYMRKPRVRMRNSVLEPWQTGTLHGVDVDEQGKEWFFVKSDADEVFDSYAMCEEIKQGKEVAK